MHYLVMRDNKVLYTADSLFDAEVWILRNQGNSIDYAINYGGYSIQEA